MSESTTNSAASAHPRLLRLFAAPWLAFAAPLIAFFLCSPSLGDGWQLDDHFQRAGLTGRLQGMFNFDSADMFAFIDGDAAKNHSFKQLGGLPWWAHDELKLSFWRPLTGWTHALDYLLWPESPWAMHLQNLLWLAALVAVAGALYRQTLGAGAVAGIATLLYAIDDAHAMPAGWIANRNAMIAAFFGVVSVTWHIRWRRDDWKPGALLAPLALALALLSGESGAGSLAYLFAASLFLDRRRDLAGKAAGLLPHAAVALAWLAALKAQGHGSRFSDFYVDPVGEPARFAVALLERAPVLLMGLLGFPPSDGATAVSPKVSNILLGLSTLYAAFLAMAFAPRFRRDPNARFFGCGMLLSLVPICATQPSDRLLFFAGIGGFGLVALFLNDAFKIDAATADPRIEGKASRFGTLAFAWYFVAFHAVFAPLSAPRRTHEARNIGKWMTSIGDSMGDDPALADDLAIIVNPPATFFVGAAPVERLLKGETPPRGIAAIGCGFDPVAVRRIDERTIALRPERGWLAPPSNADGDAAFVHLARRFETLYRSRSTPAPLGYAVETNDYRVEITELTEDGRPAEAVFQFNEPLESGPYAWYAWDNEGAKLRRYDLPAVGLEDLLPGYAIPFAILLGER